MAARVLVVAIEVLAVDESQWCRSCALPSGVRVHYVARIGMAMSLRTEARCRDCGSRDVEPA